MNIPAQTGPRWVIVSTQATVEEQPAVMLTGDDSPAWFVQSYGDRALYAFRHDGPTTVPNLEHAPQSEFPRVHFSPHPLLTPTALLPQVELDGKRVMGERGLVLESPAVQRWRCSYTSSNSDTVVLVLYVTLYANSPVVHYDGWLSRRGTHAEHSRLVSISVDAGVELCDRTQILPGDPWVAQTICPAPVKLSVPLGTARVVRLTGYGDGRPNHEEDARERMAARDYPGPVYATPDVGPHETFLGDFIPEFAQEVRSERRAYTPEDDANQPGAQGNIGANMIGAILAHADAAQNLLISSEDWGLRSSFLLSSARPGPVTIDEILDADANIADRRVFDSGELDYPRTLCGPHSLFNTLGKRVMDEQHQDDHPLHAALALTGDPVAHELVVALRNVDTASKRVESGWSNVAPRGDGRWMRSLTRSAALVGDPGNHVRSAIRHRIEVIGDKQVRFDAAGELRPWAYHSDGMIAVYEYAQIAHGAWLYASMLAPESESMGYDLARECAEIVVASTFFRGGINPFVPYRVGLLPGAQVPTNSQLLSAFDAAHSPGMGALAMEPGSNWVWWSAPAYRVALDASEDDEILRRAEIAREYLLNTPPPSIVSANFVL